MYCIKQEFTDAVTGDALLEKLFLEISQNSQKTPVLQNTIGRLLLNLLVSITDGGKKK